MSKKLNKTSAGKLLAFSLIELMVVITILSALATAAIPSYVKYLQRASLTEAMSILGNYKTALGIFWSIENRLPTTGDTINGSPVDLPFGTLVDTDLPDSIQSLQLTANGNGSLISIIINSNIFSTLVPNNRTLVLAAQPINGHIVFKCGNFSTDATSIADIGFTDITMLPKSCNYNGVGAWLTNPNPPEPEEPQGP